MAEACAVIGVGQPHYRSRRTDVSIAGLVREAALRALEDAGLTFKDIDAVVIGKAPDLVEGVMMPESYLADALGARGKPMTRVHTAGSVGGSTALVAASLVQGGVHDRVLVVAFEKQSESNATWALSTHPPLTPSLVVGAGGYFAPHIRAYMRRTGSPDHIGTLVAVKDRQNALKNPYAHLRIPGISREMVEATPMLWEPIRYLETCPSSDGAAAMVLASSSAAKQAPNPPAWVHGTAMRSEPIFFAQRDAHANRLAHHLADAGVGPGQHVGVHLYNGLEYIATVLAALKIRAVPVNVNYRYVEAELEYLYRDASLVALVYDADFEERVNAAAWSTPTLRHRLVVGGTSPHAVAYVDALAGAAPERGFAPRSADDLYIIYTGGTTGMPKGVMWRCEDLFMAFGAGNPYGEPRATPQEEIDAARASGGVTMMTTAPLMHGAAQMTTFLAWWMGGTMVFNRRFDPAETLRTIEREKVVTLGITGDAMARPLTQEIATGAYDLSSLAVISSTGAILSGA